ncbi:GNAT family N-acetyltransferase [Streptomyces californicus]|uniref:GNAT family N-acetyltransferase n=1 Tax=Streptomyces californicus TaxID=67351 RepID=UPI0037878CFF
MTADMHGGERSGEEGDASVMFGQLLDELVELRATGWDELVPAGDLLHCADWLDINARTADAPPQYALTRRKSDGELLAGLACYPLARDSAPFSFLRPDAFVARIAGNRGVSADPDLTERLGQLLPGLVCGQRRGAESRLLVSSQLSAAESLEAADVAVGVAEDFARRVGMSTVAFLFVGADDELRNVLERRGYLSFPGDTQAILDVPAGGFEDYLARLSTDRRSAVRRERRKVATAGVTYEVVPAESIDSVVLLPLEAQLLKKYGHAPELNDLASMHVEAADVFPGHVDYLLARNEEGEIVGFIQLIRKDDVVHPRAVGFDYGFRPKLPLYFDLVYYETIQYAVDRRLRAIDYSVEAKDVKEARGCRMRRLHAYVKPLDAAARAVAERVAVLLADPG